MFALPPDLARAEREGRAAASGGGYGGGSGLGVAFYEPAPRDARLETFDGLTPAETLQSSDFTLELPPAARSDSFGLLFSGTLFVPETGTYTFFTSSDDGSRLYLDRRCVVDNDGDHGRRERSGTIELAAGPHAIALTFYEQGGAQGLAVSWEGPGFAKQAIPVEVLGVRGAGGAGRVRAAAMRAMAHVPGHERQKFQDATRFIGGGTFLDPAVELLRGVPEERWPTGEIRGVVDTLAAYVSSLPAEERTVPRVVAALELGRQLAGALPAAEAEAARAQLAGLGGSIVLVRTVPHRMLYDLTEFWVEAGKPVAIVFQNNDVMPHNLVITASGAMQRVGQAAELLSGDGTNADFIPDTSEVLWHTKLLYPGQSERLTFVAPDEPGDHPFVCTFPGHWRVMNGTMHVVERVDEGMRIARRPTDADAAPAREFVRDWTMEDLAPAVTAGWEQGRSVERGKDLFDQAGCIKCHTFDGVGAKGGPELTAITEKYRGLELLNHVVEPSKEILEGYHYYYIQLEGGGDAIGRIVKEDDEQLHLIHDLQDPDAITVVWKDEIASQTRTKLSPMPTGLLVTLTKDEILDLLAYLESTAD
jgi:putative heme-binding domain-containing protein